MHSRAEEWTLFCHFNLTQQSSLLAKRKYYHRRLTNAESRLGGVVVRVPATGLKGSGFKPNRSDGFLRVLKIRSITSRENEAS
jgi:hypothetical protein